MIRQPPKSTLFPYTPLSQSQRQELASHRHTAHREAARHRTLSPSRSGALKCGCDDGGSGYSEKALAASRRSEEHTSELQSRSDLVCRLLLEKKKLRSEGYCD